MSESSDRAPEQPSTPAVDNGFVPGARVRNFFTLLMGNMSPEGKQMYRREANIRHEKADCERCDKHLNFILQYSPTVRFLRENIQRIGGDINRDTIWCKRCEERSSGGFDPQYGIKICANEMRNKGHIEQTLAHEMVHAYDHLRFKVDWQNNLKHAACTEIRASSLSGECRFMREFWTRGQWKLTQQHQECVRRRAILSVASRPYCKNDVEAAKVVNEVWDSCFTDTRPFDEIYR